MSRLFKVTFETQETKIIRADRFNVYGQGRIAFYVDHPVPRWFNKAAVDTEIVAEISTKEDFFVEQIA